MGYVSDGPKATTEKLFVAGADNRSLATLDVSQSPAWHPVGTVGPESSQPPELTGTADGQLFAFFPDAKGAFIQQLDRHSGKGVGRRMLVGSPDGTVNGWAFAFWGGVFYVFVTIDDNSMVIAVDRKTGNHRIIREHLPYRIVGAGVSTCAPLLERPGTE